MSKEGEEGGREGEKRKGGRGREREGGRRRAREGEGGRGREGGLLLLLGHTGFPTIEHRVQEWSSAAEHNLPQFAPKGH
jgi:hypothetical protein